MTNSPHNREARTLHLIDLENLAGDPDASADTIRRVWETYRVGVGIGKGDHVIVASSRHFARRSWFVLPSQGLQRRIRDGRDGADLALLDSVDLAYDSQRFGTISIASGDGAFTALALGAQARGMRVHHVIGIGSPSRRLLEACARHTWLKLGAERHRSLRLAA